jgi:hypothetical protein
MGEGWSEGSVAKRHFTPTLNVELRTLKFNVSEQMEVQSSTFEVQD